MMGINRFKTLMNVTVFRRSAPIFWGAAALFLAGNAVASSSIGPAAPEGASAVESASAVPTEGASAASRKSTRTLSGMSSRAYLVLDADSGEVLLDKGAEEPRSIASITKLLSVMVYLDMNPDLTEVVEVQKEDRKGARPAQTRLRSGYKLTTEDLLHAALIASENPAVEALARSTGLTRPEFVGMMNRKAQELGMTHAIFFDASGLDANNTASPRDVARMLEAASRYPKIAEITQMTDYQVNLVGTERTLHYYNSNRLARSESWNVVTGKTGYIRDAGYCLAVSVRSAEQRRINMVFLGAGARLSRFGDAARVMEWLQTTEQDVVASAP